MYGAKWWMQGKLNYIGIHCRKAKQRVSSHLNTNSRLLNFTKYRNTNSSTLYKIYIITDTKFWLSILYDTYWCSGHMVQGLGQIDCFSLISFDLFSRKSPNYAQYMPQVSGCSLLMFRLHDQRSRSNYWS